MKLLDAAADLLLGSACPGCDRPGLGLCAGCRAELLGRAPARARPHPCPPGFPVCVAATVYDELARRLVLAYKEQDALWLRRLLGERLAAAIGLVRVLPTTGLLLVPMPSSPRAVRARGLDVTTTLAATAARVLRRGGRRVRVVRLLRQRRRPRDQAGLTAAERWDNLHGALAARAGPRLCRRRLDSWAVVVVDDVVTTGASLTEAVRALESAGLTVAGAAVVAATQRRSRAGRYG